MTPPTTGQSRVQIGSVKSAVSSYTTCSSLTVTELQSLLNILPNPVQEDLKSNASAKALKTVAKKTRNTRPRVDNSQTVTLETLPTIYPKLSPRERYILATDVVNSCLKSLSEALKFSSKVSLPPRQKQLDKSYDDRPSRPRAHTRTTSNTQEPLRPRSINESTYSSVQQHSLNGQPSRATSFPTDLQPGLKATAQCARAAFQYLRTPEAQKFCNNETHPFQVENGMLAFIGKVVSLGMDKTAIEELRILKRRLDSKRDASEDSPELQNEPIGENSSAASGKKIFSKLLNFKVVSMDSALLALIIGYQIHVLRILASNRRPAAVDAVIEYMLPSSPSSPLNLGIKCAESQNYSSKIARHLESFSNILLSLCPSNALAEDAEALNKDLYPSPSNVLKLQCLALHARALWWQIAGHEGNAGRDLLDPFSKNVDVFIRRSQENPDHRLILVQSLWKNFESVLNHLSTQMLHAIEADKARRSILQNLASLAQSASKIEDALNWAELSVPERVATKSEIRTASVAVRKATVGLKSMESPTRGCNVEALVVTAQESLDCRLRGDAADLDVLLGDISDLRRAATKLLMSCEPDSKQDAEGSIESPWVIGALCIHSCVRFLARYVGKRRDNSDTKKDTDRHAEKLALARRLAKGFIDSAIVCCKSLIDTRNVKWEEFDVVLRDCETIISGIHQDFEENAISEWHSSAQYPLVRISNTYWAYYLRYDKKNEQSERVNLLNAVRRSVDVLSDSGTAEQASGYLSIKLERLGLLYEAVSRFSRAHASLYKAIQVSINSGFLRGIAKLAETTSLSEIRQKDRNGLLLDRIILSYQRITLKYVPETSEEGIFSGFFDNPSLIPDQRGLLLEWQLALFAESQSMSRNEDVRIWDSIANLSELLKVVYSSSDFPLRRQRAAMIILRLTQKHKDMPDPGWISWAVECSNKYTSSLANDAGLSMYQGGIRASLATWITFREYPSSIDVLQSSLRTWQDILDSSDSSKALNSQIDDFNQWISLLNLISEYLDGQGEEYLRIPALTLLSRAMELQSPQDPGMRVSCYSSLGLCFLQLGYSGKCGLVLAKAQSLLDTVNVPVEPKLRLYIAYAQYSLSLGLFQECKDTLTSAQDIAFNDPELLAMNGPTSTLSTRIKLNRLLADAYFASAMLCLREGNSTEALGLAKQSLKLNQRAWVSLENKACGRKKQSKQDNNESDVGTLTDDMNRLTVTAKEQQLVMTMTHQSLKGAMFWSLTPALFRSLTYLSHIHIHQGSYSEAVYFLEHAHKVADAVQSTSNRLEVYILMADLYIRSGRGDQAAEWLTKAEILNPNLGNFRLLALYHRTRASLQGYLEETEEQIKSYDIADKLICKLVSPAFKNTLEKMSSPEDDLVQKMVGLDVTKQKVPTKGGRSAKRGGRSTAKSSKSRTRNIATNKEEQQPTTTMSGCECPALWDLRGDILRRKALVLLLRQEIPDATDLLQEAEDLQNCDDSVLYHSTVTFRSLHQRALAEMLNDITFNGLIESTISFPSLAANRRRSSGITTKSDLDGSIQHRVGTKSSRARTNTIARADSMETFSQILQKAQDTVYNVHSLALRSGSAAIVKNICNALSHITVLLSAANATPSKCHLHPLFAALMTELPKTINTRMEHGAIQVDKPHLPRDELMKWPKLPEPISSKHPSVSDFQSEYVDIIPETWSVISMSLNENRDELYITRYQAHQSPFILRLPMSRHNSIDKDEDIFGFDEGKRELLEIIGLSDFSLRDKRDLRAKGAKTAWWEERQALDSRMEDLLLNIQNIWLGGFHGIFSEHRRQPELLGRFQTSFQNILNRHLPSRQGVKRSKQRFSFDPRILDLFIGLGDATEESLDLDEPLIDLLYFVVDVLQFNGERNAYDEIDFDALTIETLDLLRTYHSSAAHEIPDPVPHHTILILDPELHAFPWESLPALSSLSISRLPSLAALRTRILAAGHTYPSSLGPDVEGHYINLGVGGTAILNPGGDLPDTQAVLEQPLATLPQSWEVIVGREPKEKEMEEAIRDKQCLLYFGHGSGAQYIRSRTIKRLYSPSSLEERAARAPATTLLLGCSSAKIVTNGEFNPTGILLSYLTAGAPAVMGALWDVSDRDIDRFSVGVGESWGLWEKGVAEPVKAKSSKPRGRVKKCERKDKEKARENGKEDDEISEELDGDGKVSLSEAVRRSRRRCFLKYLNGAAPVVYGIPVFLR
ncbi:hypothetical protein M501DRAFT_995055 [Patellaria atrata CBS 101060]|uniref:separase n=1 Tax=Patellaria atrata CBS 101060 TaxID=1346257 RepID=A0A9P4S833_9PEZI|nr:hypothetical protein M501DRAFT_995055 [Patellaria atrata CBS 101060]